MQTQQELHILKKHAESLDSRNKKICAENLALRVRVLMKAARTVGGLAGPSPPGEPVALPQNPELADADVPLVHPPAQEKIGLLERYDFEHVQQSACMRHYTRCRVAETY